MKMRTSAAGPLLWAALCAGMALGWQALTVHYNYHGDWSGLFNIGSYTPMPSAIGENDVHRFPDAGYDGQFYHLIAHDPLLRRDTAGSVDNPRLRWRRILLPGLAFLAAGGDSERVDSAYGAVVLGFVFLGAFWLARWAVKAGLHPAWGVGFLAFPAVLVSLDRYTIDVALAALAVGFLLYGMENRRWPLLAILALAPLARETGVVLPAAFALHSARRKDWRGVGLSAAAMLPYCVWLWYLSGRTAPDQTVFASYIPFSGLLARTLHPIQDSVATRWLLQAAVLEYVAVLGMWVAAALAIWLIWKGKRELPEIAAALFTLVFVAFLGQAQAWSGVYSFGRTMSPLLIWLALAGLSSRSWLLGLPVAMALPRILLQLAPQWRAILHGLLGRTG